MEASSSQATASHPPMAGELARLSVRHDPAGDSRRALIVTISLEGGATLIVRCKTGEIQTYGALQRRVMDETGVWVTWEPSSPNRQLAAREWTEIIADGVTHEKD